MKRLHLLPALIGAFVLCAGGLARGNLLTNGDLDDPGDHESDIAVGWTLDETRLSGPDNTATFASFGNHTPDVPPDMTGTGPRVGLWYRSFVGTTDNPARADLHQDVPGTPGLKYIMTGWARFETFYGGGVNNYPVFDPELGEFMLLPSPTDTFFALEFLDAGGVVLAGSTQIELKANGQTNDNQWKQHMLMAEAPAGTVNVRVRSSAVDMVNVTGAQSAFVDDFSLIGIPEPSTLALGLLGLAGLIAVARRKK